MSDARSAVRTACGNRSFEVRVGMHEFRTEPSAVCKHYGGNIWEVFSWLTLGIAICGWFGCDSWLWGRGDQEIQPLARAFGKERIEGQELLWWMEGMALYIEKWRKNRLVQHKWNCRLAKQAAVMNSIGPQPALGLRMMSVRNTVCQWSVQEQIRRWNSIQSCRQARQLLQENSI